MAFYLFSVAGHCAMAKLYLLIAPYKSYALYNWLPSSFVARAKSN